MTPRTQKRRYSPSSPRPRGKVGPVSDRDPTSFVDIHSHLVPGVDDGARDVAASLDAVERFTRLSVRRILTTPHIDGSLTHDPLRLEERLDEVSEAWERAASAIHEHFPEVEFRRGHEILLDVPEVDFSDPRIRLAGTSFVLVARRFTVGMYDSSQS